VDSDIEKLVLGAEQLMQILLQRTKILSQ